MLRLPIFALLLPALAIAGGATAQEIDLPPQLPKVEQVMDPQSSVQEVVAPPSSTSTQTGESQDPPEPASTSDTPEPDSDPTEATETPEDPLVAVDGNTERELAALINEERSNNGLRPLKFFPRLARIARGHSGKMAKAGHIFHGLKQTARRINSWGWKLLGENVGVGATVNSLHRAFMNSTAHRANVLKSGFRRVAVGMKLAENRIWVTVIFYR